MSARLTRALGYAALAPSRPNPQGLLDYAFTEETLEAAVEAVAFDSARSLALLRNNHKLLEAIYEFFNTFDLHEPDAEIPKETIEDWKNLLYEDVFQNKSALDFTTALNKHVKSFKKLLQDPSGSEFIKHYTILASLPFAQMYMDQPIITAHEAAKVWRDAVLESTTASTYPESLYEFQVSHLERREANRKILDDLEKSIDLSNDDELSVSIRNIFDKKTEFETEVMEELTPHLSSRGTTAYMNPNFGKSPAWSKVEVSHSDQDAGDHAMTGDYATADGKQPMTESHMMTESISTRILASSANADKIQKRVTIPRST